jgi:SAM-dependent methyltransferase
MNKRLTKSATDVHWNERARHEGNVAKVNIEDTVQRDLELKFVFRHLTPGARVLEVGCGNGYLTQQVRQRVAFVDAFDFSEDMIGRGKELYSETNNRFYHDSVLDPKGARGPYDIALCIRVLINLTNLDEQKIAINNIASLLKPGGTLLLMEGFQDGFDAINGFRKLIGMSSLTPARINYYSSLAELMPTLQELFIVADTFNTGLFDFLTRIVYPALEGAERTLGPGEFHHKIEPIVRAYDRPEMATFARVHGLALVRRQTETGRSTPRATV